MNFKYFSKISLWLFLVFCLSFGILLTGCGGGGGSSSGGGTTATRNISGQVLDENGDPLPGAVVALYFEQRSRTLSLSGTAVADEDGAYSFPKAAKSMGVLKFWRTQEEYNEHNTPWGTVYLSSAVGDLTNVDLTAGRFFGMEFVTIPAGEFTMGSPEDEGGYDEHPQHTVYLDAYQIGKYEITNAQFALFIAESGYTPQGNWRNFGANTPSDYPDNYSNYPVINVSWNDAKAFCDWAGAHWDGWEGCQLPTEAQWEKAARGTDARLYPWGNDWNADNCNNRDSAYTVGMLDMFRDRGTMPVGSFPGGVSTYGVMDMAGNVWEWCSDWYDSSYYSVSPYSNPVGPVSGTYKILRGGCWGLDHLGIDYFYCAYRCYYDNPAYYNGFNGFRCAKPIISSTPRIDDITPASVEEESNVTITGNGFGDSQVENTVSFGGVSAGSAGLWSETQIVCTVPSGVIGTVAVVVMVDGKTSNSYDLNVTASSLDMEWVTVPAGEFIMGSPDGIGRDNEHPQHIVYLDAYQIGKYEVTNAQFARFIQDSDYVPQGDWRHFVWGGLTPADYPDNYPNYPVINVTWNDAKAFCDYYGYHLPTEAQWEKAARGTDARLYPWGNDWDSDKCNNEDSDYTVGILNIYDNRGTTPVGSFPSGASPYGVIDMAGNVWEWCNDWEQWDYYSVSPYNNPSGPSIGSDKIFRGGSWKGSYYGNINDCRCAFRYCYDPSHCNIISMGFRCAR